MAQETTRSFSVERMQEMAMPYVQSTIDVLLSVGKGLLILLVGWLIARYLKKVITKLLKKIKLDEFVEKVNLDVFFDKVGIKDGLSSFLGLVLYYVIMLFVIMGASNAAGLSIIAEKIQGFLDFVPSIVSAMIIFLFGMVIAGKIRDLIYNVTASLGSSAGKILSGLIYYFVLILLSITALDQLGIDTALISNNLVLIIGIAMLSGTLAYGLAAKDIMSNILSSYFGKRNFTEGQIVEMDDTKGEIIKIDNVSVTLLVEGDKKVVIPSSYLMKNKVVILEDVEIEEASPDDE